MKIRFGILFMYVCMALFAAGCGCGGNDVNLVSVTVTPSDQAILMGANQQFAAMGTYSDNTTKDITTLVAWSSSNPAVAEISNSTGSEGRALGVFTGQVVIKAETGGISGTASLTVKSKLVSIAVTPKDKSLMAGTSQQFTATGTYSDNTTNDITNLVVWSSSNIITATISNDEGARGLAAGLAAGVTTISASSDSIIGSTALTVTPTPHPSVYLVSIEVLPKNPSVTFGKTVQFSAIGTYSDGSKLDITQLVFWSSSDTTIATISNASGSKGLALTDHKYGETIISATLDGVTGSTTLLDP